MDYIVRTQFSSQLYFDYLSYNLPDYKIEDNNTYFKNNSAEKKTNIAYDSYKQGTCQFTFLLFWSELSECFKPS